VLTWTFVLAVCLLALAFFYLVGVALDLLLNRYRNHDLDEVFHRDKAREAMKRWTEGE
jgi:hypothetical protein